MKKKLGRPRKKPGVISFRNFQRAGMVMALYDEARQRGQKHSAAVTQAVEFIKQHRSEMRISETEVKRTLATWRPRGNHTVLLLSGRIFSNAEIAQRRRTEPQPAAKTRKKGSMVPVPSDVILPKSVTTFSMRFGERPNYPRHNQKPQKV